MLRVGFVLRSTEIQPVCFRFVSPTGRRQCVCVNVWVCGKRLAANSGDSPSDLPPRLRLRKGVRAGGSLDRLGAPNALVEPDWWCPAPWSKFGEGVLGAVGLETSAEGYMAKLRISQSPCAVATASVPTFRGYLEPQGKLRFEGKGWRRPWRGGHIRGPAGCPKCVGGVGWFVSRALVKFLGLRGDSRLA